MQPTSISGDSLSGHRLEVVVFPHPRLFPHSVVYPSLQQLSCINREGLELIRRSSLASRDSGSDGRDRQCKQCLPRDKNSAGKLLEVQYRGKTGSEELARQPQSSREHLRCPEGATAVNRYWPGPGLVLAIAKWAPFPVSWNQG